MDFKIEHTDVYGLRNSVIKSGNSMRTEIQHELSDEEYEKAYQRMTKLSSTPRGFGEDNALKGVIVQFDIYAPLYWWKQAQRYHWFEFISSQSTMHCITRFDIQKHCNEYVWKETITKLEEKIKLYNSQKPKDKNLWYEIVANVPSGFILGASMTTNYQQLKTMVLQRENHKLKEWHTFCRWALSLPSFAEFIGVVEKDV